MDRSVDAVGYQATNTGSDTEVPNIVLENMIKVTRACGGLGIPGLYVPKDPGAPDDASGKGMLSLSFGKLFEKVSVYADGVMITDKMNRGFLWRRDNAMSSSTVSAPGGLDR